MDMSSDDSEIESEEVEDGLGSVHNPGTNTSGSPSDLGKKRKQETEISPASNREEKEPCNKRVKAVSKLKRFSQTFQRLSLKTDSFPAYSPSRPWARTGSAQVKSRNCKLWIETFESVGDELSATEIRRQEVIFELTQGEQALIDDLNITRKAYYDPMLKLCIIPENELNQIFGSLYSLIPLHEDLTRRLQNQRKKDGTVDNVGATLLEWLPSLPSLYQDYCCNLVLAKALLDQQRLNPRVTEFLRLCRESAFSRKLDLWSFLDLPRSRLVKYPLLLKEILKLTPSHHPDHSSLTQAMSAVQGVVCEVDEKAGEAECQYFKERLYFLDNDPNDRDIKLSRALCCRGQLRNSKGSKLEVLLFERVLVVTRLVTRAELPVYQVYRQPIPVHQLVLEDLPDGEGSLGGSIRGAFTPGTERAKHVFRVSFRDHSRGQSHTLHANDSFSKQQWITCIRHAIVTYRDTLHSTETPPTPSPATDSPPAPPINTDTGTSLRCGS